VVVKRSMTRALLTICLALIPAGCTLRVDLGQSPLPTPPPDIAPASQPAPDSSTIAERLTTAADTAGPGLTEAIGGLLGVGWLVGLGLAWRSHRFGQILRDVVLSIQKGRELLQKKHPAAAEGFDKCVEDHQENAGTAVKVLEIKNRYYTPDPAEFPPPMAPPRPSPPDPRPPAGSSL